ncbi:ammonium transporter [Oenococcus oeni]|uniref:ammonium transporter n=1 Tax=Oenococcus oeni TaxID=1247 RepID=UPI000277BA95|nr:ammonium transporter [Oenococcus oeni]EJO03230.1 ammonia permease [Oenococcus oeni AWRIB418]KEP87294.1 ammonia permease [Oenococcus oeni IOEB_0501]KGH59816.1 ammonia permease [Oenococcus oeni IOEB_9805]KGH75079.1 ammonia permease [Oenococcus oeni IOEB_9803]KGH77275.1 ammonia permease [Oenococcus oeni IOEB_8417]
MSTANTTFLILSSVLVLFMTPGLAFFYGGLGSKKNVVNTMMSVFVMCGLAVVLWVICGYSLSFVGDFGGVFGSLSALLLHGVKLTALTSTKIPTSLYLIFQMMFAVITPALFVGAVVGRIRFKFLLLFTVFWSIFIYYPLVHMVWANGFLAKMGVIDFAGGTVVHIDAGVTALVLAYFLGPRIGYRKGKQEGHYSLPWALLGTTILWIGWYGFNAGSALAANQIAVQAVLTTTVATACSMITWMLIEMSLKGKATLAGICNGTLCGLVGITPSTGYVTVAGSFWIGILAAVASYFFVNFLKARIGIDDALDAFGCHGVCGIVGSILTGLFASRAVNSSISINGLFYGGGFKLFAVQLFATLFSVIFTALICFLIIKFLKLFMKMRVDVKEEQKGLDFGEHGENVDYVISLTLEAYQLEDQKKEFFQDEPNNLKEVSKNSKDTLNSTIS